MTKQPGQNSYDPDDLRQIVGEIEDIYEIERAEKAAAGKKRLRDLKAAENRAKQLGILIKPLRAQIAVRKLKAKIKDRIEDVPEDELEVYEDMEGQLSFIAPVAGDDVADAEVKKVVAKRKKAAKENEDREQAEGGKVLDELLN